MAWVGESNGLVGYFILEIILLILITEIMYPVDIWKMWKDEMVKWSFSKISPEMNFKCVTTDTLS